MSRAWHLGPGVAVQAAAGSAVARALDEVFASLAAPATDDDHRLASREVADGLRLELDGMALSTVAPDALAPALEGAVVGWAVRSRRCAAAFHAACVSWGPRAVLLVGAKGSGKSTLAGHLATAVAGCRYHGDEVTFVRFSDGSIAPFAKAATIKHGSFACFAETTTWRDPVRGPVRYVAPAPAALAAGPAVTPAAIVFPQWTAGHPGASAEPVTADRAVLELIGQTFGSLGRDPRTLAVVVQLASLPVITLRYGDLAAAADAVAGIADGSLAIGDPT